MATPFFGRAGTMICLLLAAAAGGACASAGSLAPPAATGPQAGLASLDAQIGERIARGRYPGAAYGMARGDRVLALEAVGAANVGTGEALRTDSIFQLMSMTKPVTAVAALILVEEGRLALDAPVSRVLPEFESFGVAGAPPLTLRHLLTHTSGIGFGSLPSGQTTLAQHVQEIAARRMTTPAGARWEYSGVDGPDVIARMVEVVAGEPYDRFIQRHIFDPLRMRDTTYTLSPEQERRLVGLYASQDGALTEARPMFPPLTYPSGGAGLYSTAADFLRFAQMLANEGVLDGARILEPETVAQLRQAQLPAGFAGLPSGLAHGFLVRQVADPAAAGSPLPPQSYGWSGAYGTHFWIDPRTGFAAFWMINLANAGGAGSADALDFERMVMGACAADRRC